MAVGVTVVFLVSMVSVVTHAIANAQFAKNKTLAGKYVEEGLEKSRSLRDQTSWQTFQSSSYSVNIFPAPSPFTRSVTFTNEGTDKKRVTVTVSWTDSKGTHNTQGVTYLTKWN